MSDVSDRARLLICASGMAELLTDKTGIYGLAFRETAAAADEAKALRRQDIAQRCPDVAEDVANAEDDIDSLLRECPRRGEWWWLDNYRSESVCIITRPDRLAEKGEYCRHAVLQPISDHKIFRHSAEGRFANALLTAMLARAGLDLRRRTQGWWSDIPAVQAANRRRFHAYKRSALAITNSLMRHALTAAPQDVLTLARRFPHDGRFAIYEAGVLSPRMAQLADAFPLLAYVIVACPSYRKDEAVAEAKRLVEAGARLRTIASLLAFPMALRKVKPGAVRIAMQALYTPNIHGRIADAPEDHGLIAGVPNISALIHDAMPQGTAAQRRWWCALYYAGELGGPYVDWVGRNAHLLGTTKAAVSAQTCDIGNFVRASYVAGVPRHTARMLRWGLDEIGERHIVRPFSLEMSVATVRELSSQWHETVALSDPISNAALPAPWRGPDTIGTLSIVPLESAAAIAGEGRAMHHCASTLIGKVRDGASYLFSVRDGEARLATVEVCRFGDRVLIAQMRGLCNAILPEPLQAWIVRWACQTNKWTLPVPVPSGADLHDNKPPF